MADIWLSNFGIRVSDFQKSIDFYTKVFDFEEVAREEYGTGKYVLFRDRRSKQRFELNWYSEASPFWAPSLQVKLLITSMSGSRASRRCLND